jgi:hypothetical protein
MGVSGRQGVRRQKTEVRSQETEVRRQKSGDRSQETEVRRQEVRRQESGVRSQSPGVRESGVRSQESGVRSQEQESGGRRQEAGGREAGGRSRRRRQKAEGRRQKAEGQEGRRQKTGPGIRGHKKKCRKYNFQAINETATPFPMLVEADSVGYGKHSIINGSGVIPIYGIRAGEDEGRFPVDPDQGKTADADSNLPN